MTTSMYCLYVGFDYTYIDIMYVCIYVCMYVSMYVTMYVCIYVCMYVVCIDV